MMYRMSGYTQLAAKITAEFIKNDNVILQPNAAYIITKSLQMSEDTIILFISS